MGHSCEKFKSIGLIALMNNRNFYQTVINSIYTIQLCTIDKSQKCRTYSCAFHSRMGCTLRSIGYNPCDWVKIISRRIKWFCLRNITVFSKNNSLHINIFKRLNKTKKLSKILTIISFTTILNYFNKIIWRERLIVLR